jgi:FMN phosphatase YigB (HAD superfamily)
MSGSAEREPAAAEPTAAEPAATKLGRSIEAVTLDFGNTLVAFSSTSMGGVLADTAARAADRWNLVADEFARVWGEERGRQLAEEVPLGREADMDVRAARVLARLRGHRAPPAPERWDDAEVAGWSSPEEVGAILDDYSAAFVRLTPVPAEIEPLLAVLAARYRVAILSNWPIAAAVERFVEAAGWSVHLSGLVISQRVGAIKPRPEIFAEAARVLGVASGPRLLHVGDDLGADVAGAHALGWRTVWVRSRPEDSPLPVAPTSGGERPDLIVDRVTDLPQALGLTQPGIP